MRSIRVRSAHAVLVWLTALAAVLSLPAIVRQVDGRRPCIDYCHCVGVGVSASAIHWETAICPFEVVPDSTGVEINA